MQKFYTKLFQKMPFAFICIFFFQKSRFCIKKQPPRRNLDSPIIFSIFMFEAPLLSFGGRAQRRRCRPLSSTSCWRPRPRLQGRPRLYSLGDRFYLRIPRRYGLHPVGSGRSVFADSDPHSSRLSIWVPEAASTSSSGLSQVAAVLAVLYSLASRLGLLLRQMRIQPTDPRQRLQNPPGPASLFWPRRSASVIEVPRHALACPLLPRRQ